MGKLITEGDSITVWLDPDTRIELDREVAKTGLTRSWVLRHLIKRWLLARRAGKREVTEKGALAL